VILDLTMPIDSSTPNYPGEPECTVRQHSTVEDGGIAKKILCFHSHFSTHIDAPSHMIEGGKTLSDFPLATFIGDAIVMDVRGAQEIEPDLDMVREGDMVFFLTDQSRKPKEKYFDDNPVLSLKTAEQLVERKARIIGIDSSTPDNAPYDIHKLFFKHDILIVENLVGLERLSGLRFRCIVLPLNIRDGDGAPCRVLAIVEQDACD